MTKKFYTSGEIIEFATKNKAACTFASLATRTFTYTNKGGLFCLVQFDRVEPLVWKKRVRK
jgi:hypothetical protein